jgi:hypothetical protein
LQGHTGVVRPLDLAASAEPVPSEWGLGERHAIVQVVASSNLDEILNAIRGLPVPERLKLVERVVHEITESQAASNPRRDPHAVIGSFADIEDVMEQVCEAAMVARERDPLRLPDG